MTDDEQIAYIHSLTGNLANIAKKHVLFLLARLDAQATRVGELENVVKDINETDAGTINAMADRLHHAEAVVEQAKDRDHEPFKRKGERRSGNCKLCMALSALDAAKESSGGS